MPRSKRAPDMCRFTAWISERERDALDDIARQENCSVNFIVRSAIRRELRERGFVSQLSQVTNHAAS